jgi:hypothetical protein
MTHLTWAQGLGTLSSAEGFFAKGYAGHGIGKNNPDLQHVKNVGPIPLGWYTIEGEPFTHPRCGQFCLRLVPDAENEMFGRSGFLLHGDNAAGTASEGCIVAPRAERELIVSEGYKRLQVVK